MVITLNKNKPIWSNNNVRYIYNSMTSEKWWSRGLSIEGTAVQSHLPLFRNLGNFVHPTFACVFQKRHLKPVVPSIWCLYQGKQKIPHRG